MRCIEEGAEDPFPSMCIIRTLLGGSWVVISRVINPLIWVIIIATQLRTPLVTTHEPPSNSQEEDGDTGLLLGFLVSFCGFLLEP